MTEGNPITSQIQILDDISGIDRAINKIDNLIQSLERLENTANRAFDVFNNIPDINIPDIHIPDIPEVNISETPEPPEISVPPTISEPSPLNWNPQSNIDIFNSSGIERYNQELTALDTQMQRLMESQTQVDSLASNMDLIPDNMISDINNVNDRILNLRNIIQGIRQEGIDDIGADRVNNQVERLRELLNSALNRQTALNGAIQHMDAARAQREYRELNNIIGNAERHIRDNISQQESFNNAIRDGTGAAGGLMSKLKAAAGIYASIQGLKSAIGLADEMAQSTARLNMIVDDGGSVDDLKNRIFAVAEDSRADYMQTMDLVGKLGLQAGNAFSNNNELLSFADQLNKQFAIAGTNAEGIQAATLQLTQALGSGVLRGEEFNSIFEQAPNIMRSIADYLGKDIGEMKDLAATGAITANVVKNALLSSAKQTNETFAKMPKTFSQIWTSIKNNAIRAFEPILKKMNEIANSKGFQRFAKGVTDAFVTLGKILSIVFEIVCSIAEYFSDNWEDIGPIVKVVATAVMSLATALGVYEVAAAGATAATKLFSKALWANPATIIIAVIAAIVAALIWLTNELGGVTATWELVKMTWELGCIKMELTWERTVSRITYVVDTLEIAMVWCKNQVLNKWDLMKLGIAKCAYGICDIIGDLKAGVLQIIQDMVNGSIGMINELIGAINSLGAKIEPIKPVTFGTSASIANSLGRIQRDMEIGGLEREVNAKVTARDMELSLLKIERERKMAESGVKMENILNDMDKTYKEGMANYNAALIKNAADPILSANQQADLILGMLNGIGTEAEGGIGDIDRVGKVDKVGGTVDVSSEDLKRMRDIYENDIIQEVYQSDITPQVSIQFGDVKETADVDMIVEIIKSKIKEGINVCADGLH